MANSICTPTREGLALPGVRGTFHIDQDGRPAQKCHMERECSSREDRIAVIVSPATADLEPYWDVSFGKFRSNLHQ